jgi:nitrogen fixation NifU-like protein
MVNLESLYQELILDHYKNPLNKGLESNPSASVHHVNPSCGDEVDLNLIVDGESIVSVTWDGVGCSISQASTSVLTDLVQGKSIGGDPEILGDAVAFSGVSKYPARIKCALLGWMALKDAMLQAKVIR